MLDDRCVCACRNKLSCFLLNLARSTACEWGGHRFEVVDIGGTKIDQALVTQAEAGNVETPD